MYRNYYIQQYKDIKQTLEYNYNNYLNLNKEIYVLNKIPKNQWDVNYYFLLRQKNIGYEMQCNILTYLTNNAWEVIDKMNENNFPGINLKYDKDFRNISILFELLDKLINFK